MEFGYETKKHMEVSEVNFEEIEIIDNEEDLVSRPPVVTIMAMFIGVKIFGAMGIFILPFIVIIINLLNEEGIIHLFKTKKKPE